MKRLTYIFTALLLLTSCSTEIQQLAGTYSYKASGDATVENVTVSLDDEIGTLELIPINEKDSFRLIFNQVGGPVYTTIGLLYKDGTKLDIKKFERTIKTSAINYNVTVTGDGDVLDGILMLNLQYHGQSAAGVDIKSTNVLMIAKKNDK